MDIDDLIQLFTYKTSFAYYKIIEECNDKINNKSSLSEYYYFKSMAILGILSIEGKLKNSTCIYKHKSTQYNESIVNQYHSVDEVLKYYQNAIFINPKICHSNYYTLLLSILSVIIKFFNYCSIFVSSHL